MLEINVNGESRSLDAPREMPLLLVLRDLMGLTTLSLQP
jgi:aerobic-type carbon monoxide dehydrogenase small subunit (CoxS/CutS family)